MLCCESIGVNLAWHLTKWRPAQVSLADAIDDALASGEARKEHGNNGRFQVGTCEIATAEVDRWRKLRAIPTDARQAHRVGDCRPKSG